MKIGAVIERHKSGKFTVKGLGPDSVAAAAGFAIGDEITHVGRIPSKKIRLNEEGGIDFRRGQTVRVLRSGESIRLTIPAREKPSPKYVENMRAVERADPDQLEHLAREMWSCHDLSDSEKEKLGFAIDGRRRALRRGQERELPLAESPAVGVGPPGNYYHDKEHWRRQIAADADLSPLARQIANIIEAEYVSNKKGSQYLCAWPSTKVLRRVVKRAQADVGKAIHELQARGHCKLIDQGPRKPRMIALVLKRSQRSPSPVPTPAQPVLGGGRTDQELAAIETASPSERTAVLAPAPIVPAQSFGGLMMPEGVAVAIPLRNSPIAIAVGRGTLQKREVKSTRAVTPESEAKRIKEAALREAEEAQWRARNEEIKWLQTNQARSEPLFESNYNSLGYGRIPLAGSPLREGDPRPFAGTHRRWYEGR